MSSKKPREHRRELNKLLALLDDKQVCHEIMEVFDDLQKRRNLYRDQLAELRGKYKRLTDCARGINRGLEFSFKYVMEKTNMNSETGFSLYYEKASGRFCVFTKKEPEGDSHELIGVYTPPLSKVRIRQDMKAFYEELGQ